MKEKKKKKKKKKKPKIKIITFRIVEWVTLQVGESHRTQ